MADVSDRWTRIQTLFEDALERPPDERTAWLRSVCGSDPEVYAHVAAMLDGQAHEHEMFGGRAVDLVPPHDLAAVLAPSGEGERVGPWVLGEPIGTGGMGAVYRAEREGGFEQVAALKRIKRGMDSEAVLARFRAERQILARLQHPGIARLLDGGLANDGRPYFAMELVDGEPITDWCDARRLGIDARLALFERVCEAVAYAHRQLVVHRDLKPSNVLVTEADGAPQVKLLDFGIARVLSEEDGEDLTRPGQRVFTPGYAAPEQIRGEAPTTSTDVYALGVLLYRLLSGTRPIETADRTRAEIEMAVLNETPRRPSEAAPAEAARQRGTAEAALTRQLAGDLDTICLKALRKEPERRYGSAAELLADVRRHREGFPIEARPATRRYRAGLFVRRHRGAVVTAATALVVLGALTGFYTARLGAERDRAETEAETAREVAAFLADLFTGADPARARGAVLTAPELLEQGAARVERELAGQPVVQAQMFGTIGGVYHSLGLLDEADAALSRALALLDSLGDEPLATARAQTALARLRVDQGAFGEADSLLSRALAASGGREEAAFDHAEALEGQGILLRETGDYEASEASLLEALALRRSLLPGDQEETARLLSELGETNHEFSRYDNAEASYTEALAMRRRLHGDRHPGVTESLRRLAGLHLTEGAFDLAEPLIREARATDSLLVGVEHPAFVEDLVLYADLLRDRSRIAQAYEVYDRALALITATFGADHPRVANTLASIGEAAIRTRDLDRAIEYHTRALEMRQRVLPEGHADIAHTLNKLGQIAIADEDFETAERYTRDGLAALLQTYDDDHLFVLNHKSTLARLLSNIGQHEEAVALTREILDRRTALLGRSHRTTTRSVFNLALVLRRQGTPESIAEARTVAEEMLVLYARGFAPDSREWAYALREYADVLRAAGEEPEARETYRRALDVFRVSLGPDHPVTRSVEERLREG